jgi:hypothetical protein
LFCVVIEGASLALSPPFLIQRVEVLTARAIMASMHGGSSTIRGGRSGITAASSGGGNGDGNGNTSQRGNGIATVDVSELNGFLNGNGSNANAGAVGGSGGSAGGGAPLTVDRGAVAPTV